MASDSMWLFQVMISSNYTINCLPKITVFLCWYGTLLWILNNHKCFSTWSLSSLKQILGLARNQHLKTVPDSSCQNMYLLHSGFMKAFSWWLSMNFCIVIQKLKEWLILFLSLFMKPMYRLCYWHKFVKVAYSKI